MGGKIRLYRDRLRLGFSSWVEYFYQSVKYRFPSRPGKEIYIDVDSIKLTINDRALSRSDERYRKVYKSVNSVIAGAFWDHVQEIDDSAIKLIGFRERFQEGRDWEDTSLFKKYGAMLLLEGKVQGCTSIGELVDLYKKEHDALYKSICEGGVKSSRTDVRITPIYVYIHKNGDFVFTSGGNHRLNMAKVIGVKQIPVKIKGRHVEWQELRDEFLDMGCECFIEKYPDLAGHPDLVR